VLVLQESVDVSLGARLVRSAAQFHCRPAAAAWITVRTNGQVRSAAIMAISSYHLRLLICIVGIYFFYIWYAIVQERMYDYLDSVALAPRD
jgi:hypothetical protein